MVEHHVANVIVAGSTPVTRSKFLNRSGRLAQSVEQGTENPRVPSSILGPATIFFAQIRAKKYEARQGCASWYVVPLHAM